MSTKGSGTISVFTILEAFRRRMLLIIIPAVLLTVGFALYAYQLPNRYRAQALVAAENASPNDYMRDVTPEALNIQEHLWTVREVLFSPEVLSGAAHEMNDYRDVKGPLPEAAVNALKSNVNVKVESEHTFHIIYEGKDPGEVMNVTNKLADLFVQHASAKHQEVVKDTQGVIDQQINDLKSKLAQKDEEVKKYKQSAVTELPQALDSNMKMAETLQQRYDEITSKIADEQSKRTIISRQIVDMENHGVENTPMITEKTSEDIKLDELRIQEKELSTRYTPQHPEILRIQRNIRDLEAAIATSPKKPRSEPTPTFTRFGELKSELQGIDQRIDSYRRDQSNLSAQIEKYRSRVAAAPQHEEYLKQVDHEYHVEESQLHDLLDKRLNTEISGNIQKSESGIAFAVAESASRPSSPSSPQRDRLILMGLCAGLGLGLAAAFLLEQHDTTFSNVEEFQSFTSFPTIGTIPTVPTRKNANPQQLVITATDPDSVSAEQYRVLAMKVQQQCEAQNAKVVMLTSAAGGEGKSMTAVNLAQALASMAEGSVLLIDADMRKPRTHEYLGLKIFEGRGLYSLLQSGDGDYGKHTVQVRNFSVIPGSKGNVNPVAVLSSPKARSLFDKLRQNFRYIIVDAPPTLPVADSHLLAGLSDKVLFVVRARKTPRELFQHAVESFDAANLMGAVLNDVDYQRSRYAYAYQYYKKSA